MELLSYNALTSLLEALKRLNWGIRLMQKGRSIEDYSTELLDCFWNVLVLDRQYYLVTRQALLSTHDDHDIDGIPGYL